jgi:hypothetical protein
MSYRKKAEESVDCAGTLPRTFLQGAHLLDCADLVLACARPSIHSRKPQRNAILMAVHSHELRGHHWSCKKMLSAFPLKEGQTAHMLMASRSTFMVAFVPSADRTLHSADTDQRRLSAGHRCLCLPDHRQRRTGRTHQRKDCRRLRRRGNLAA